MRISAAANEGAVAREAVAYAAGALNGQVAALLRGTQVLATTGPAARDVANADLVAFANGTAESVGVVGIGLAAVAVSAVGDGSDVRLLAARSAADPFCDEELHLLQDIAAALARVWIVERSNDDAQPTHRTRLPEEPDGAQRALRKSEHRLREILQAAPTPFVTFDAEGLVLEWNVEAEAAFGWPHTEAIGRRFLDCMIAPGDRAALEAELEAIAAAADEAERSERIELAALHRDGHEFPIEMNLSRVPAGGSYIIQAFVEDLSESVRAERERREAEDRIAYMALHDPLTDLPNRALLFDRLAHALAGARRHGTAVAVLFVDVDNFRLVNERLGHRAGDELLVELSGRLREAIRHSDTMARVGDDTLVRSGGDEFVIVCENIDGERDAVAIADRVASKLTAAFDVAGTELEVTASIGIALAGDADPDTLISEAEAAVCRAKERGRARYELFDPEVGARVVARQHRESELWQAIERHQLRLLYQPIVSVSDGGLVGAEALVRWEHPERGLLVPAEFLALAEETGMIVPLGRWVLEEACAQATRWQGDGLFPRVAVNSSAHQLVEGELMPLVTDVLARTGLDPSRLMLEITETVLVEEGKVAVDLLTELRALGVRISLDDFGTGYSSLSYLRRLPLDAVKLDRAFTSGLDETTVDCQIVAALVQMARALSMTVIAEGVETETQWARLRELGCHFAQGYYFARPMPAAQMTSLLEDASARGGVLHLAPEAAATPPLTV